MYFTNDCVLVQFLCCIYTLCTLHFTNLTERTAELGPWLKAESKKRIKKLLLQTPQKMYLHFARSKIDCCTNNRATYCYCVYLYLKVRNLEKANEVGALGKIRPNKLPI